MSQESVVEAQPTDVSGTIPRVRKFVHQPSTSTQLSVVPAANNNQSMENLVTFSSPTSDDTLSDPAGETSTTSDPSVMRTKTSGDLIKQKQHDFFAFALKRDERASPNDSQFVKSSEKVAELKKCFEMRERAEGRAGVASHFRIDAKATVDDCYSEVTLDAERLDGSGSVAQSSLNLDIGNSRESFEKAKKYFESK